MKSQKIAIVKEWHKALNEHGIRKLSGILHEQVRLGGTLGEAEGVEALLACIENEQVDLIPQRYYCRGEVVVVEELGAWHGSEKQEVTQKQTVASVFVVKDHRIISIMRYDELSDALQAAGLSEADKVIVD